MTTMRQTGKRANCTDENSRTKGPRKALLKEEKKINELFDTYEHTE